MINKATSYPFIVGSIADKLCSVLPNKEYMLEDICSYCFDDNAESALWNFLLQMSSISMKELYHDAVDYCEPCLDVIRLKAEGEALDFVKAGGASIEADDGLRCAVVRASDPRFTALSRFTQFPTDPDVYDPGYVILFSVDAVLYSETDDKVDRSETIIEYVSEAMCYYVKEDVNRAAQLTHILLKCLEDTRKKDQ